MKKYIYVIITLLTIALVSLISMLYSNNNKLKIEIDNLKNNEKAYVQEINNSKNEAKVFKYTIEQLKYSEDSLVSEMNKIRKELKIKDKDLKELQHLLVESSKKDTIRIKDTIFREKFFALDTLFGDQWYNCRLELKYPGDIIIEPKFKSDINIITHYKKETVEPPKKFFLCRWFQRKHKVVEVDVIDKNPYNKIKERKFIEIIK